MARHKKPDNPYSIWNVTTKPYVFAKARPGETFRKCVECGQEYRPQARNQKYCCKECKERRANG